MSMLVVYVLGLFPAVAAIAVIATALADHHETTLLNDLRELGTETLCGNDELESSAA
jgi:hypothetical protein